jgi:hypothetical protein
MGLTHPDRAAEDYRFFPLDKPAGSQVTDILGRYFGVKIEIKRFKAFLFLEVCLGNPAGQSLISPVLGLILKK